MAWSRNDSRDVDAKNSREQTRRLGALQGRDPVDPQSFVNAAGSGIHEHAALA